jgi:hypothetical protein
MNPPKSILGLPDMLGVLPPPERALPESHWVSWGVHEPEITICP